MRGAEQTELCLPRRTPEDRLREELAELVTAMNSEFDPRERCALYVRIQHLRRRIAAGGAH